MSYQISEHHEEDLFNSNMFSSNLTEGMIFNESDLDTRGAKRGGAWEHCSQKEMDQTILGRKILAKSTALVEIFVKKSL